MQRDRHIQELLLRQVRDGKKSGELDSFPDELVCYNAALLIEGGFVEGKARRDVNWKYTSASLVNLRNAGHDLLEEIDAAKAGTGTSNNIVTFTMDIFISHSSADSEVAKALIRVLRSSFSLESKAIRCTSINGYRLSVGADTDDQLRQEVRESKAFIGIITPTSIESAYVLFELGARWGAGLPLCPVLAAGADSGALRGPLSGINALSLSVEAQIHQLLDDLGRIINRSPSSPSSYVDEVRMLAEIASKPSPSAPEGKHVSPNDPTEKWRTIRALYEVDRQSGWAVEKSTRNYFCSKCLLKEPPVEAQLIDRLGNGDWRCLAKGCGESFPSPARIQSVRRQSEERNRLGHRGDGF